VLTADYDLSLAKDMGMTATGGHVHYEANTSATISRSPTITLKICDKWDFQLHAIAPVLSNGWALLGEPNKWVPVSNARFRDLAHGTAGAVTSASVTAVGVVGEKVLVAFLAPKATAPTVVVCTVGSGSAVSVRVSSASPKGECVPLSL
jgi:hypothetical protein